MGQIDVRVPLVETAGRYWRDLSRQLLNLFFPPRCMGCGRVGVHLCADCSDLVPRVLSPFCVRCGDAVETGRFCKRCRVSPLRIESVRSVACFEGFIQEAIHHLKYDGHFALAEPLGGLMANYWAACGHPVDVVVPVPLHAQRLRERGYNQAALLAREMVHHAGLPVDERTLVRNRATASQIDLDAVQRKENVRDAFVCVDDRLAGKRVLLIDDVCTTGSTLEACAVALYEGGAQHVRALTLARAY
ncbi:MAG TPA: ComF family protein [Chloroflexi bacterium]|nr:ComF family protein [Chloroflexota bacterium]